MSNMRKKILKLIKNFVLAFVMLYTLNVLLINVGIFVPINVYTVSTATFLGIFGTVTLVILSIIII